MCDFDLSILLPAFAGQPWSLPPIPYDMGCTTTPLGHDRPEIGLKSSSIIAQTVHRSPPTRSHKSLDPGVSKVSHHRLRRTKSYALLRKKRQTATDTVPRSSLTVTSSSPEKGSAMSLFPGGSEKRDRTLVCFFMRRCMRHKVHSTRRSPRRRSSQIRFWSSLLFQGYMVSSRVSLLRLMILMVP